MIERVSLPQRNEGVYISRSRAREQPFLARTSSLRLHRDNGRELFVDHPYLHLDNTIPYPRYPLPPRYVCQDLKEARQLDDSPKHGFRKGLNNPCCRPSST